MIIGGHRIMGGNGSYGKEYGGVPLAKRSHIDTSFRVKGHKVLVLAENTSHAKIPMNSNSESPIYLVAKVNEHGELLISSVAIYEDHKVAKVIDLRFDKDGKSMSYGNGKGTHMHNWQENNNGDMGRKSHDKNNIYPVEGRYEDLVEEIVKLNSWKHKYE